MITAVVVGCGMFVGVGTVEWTGAGGTTTADGEAYVVGGVANGTIGADVGGITEGASSFGSIIVFFAATGLNG